MYMGVTQRKVLYFRKCKMHVTPLISVKSEWKSLFFLESEKPNDEMETDCVEVERKAEKKQHRAKLLQFHENRRPPYWGTWRKKSKFVRPRAPLNQDKVRLC